jgi:hypothetical protein
MIRKTRVALTAALLTLDLMGCRSRSVPRYIVTATPIDAGVSSRGLCIAVDPNNPVGVWWWEPGRSGCSSRSTGPRVFRADHASVATHTQTTLTDVHFRVQLITGPRDAPRFADIRLELRNTDIRAMPSGMQVASERRQDLEIPEAP